MIVDYAGIFILNEELIRSEEQHHLVKPYSPLHCTFKYRPTSDEIEIFNQLVGKNINIYLIGYGYDDNNSGFEIEFELDTGESIEDYYINFDRNGLKKKKHITVSLSENGKAVNTTNLNFERYSTKIGPFKGIFGYCVIDKEGRKGICCDPIDFSKKKTM